MNIPFMGELAAIGTAIAFSIGPTFFTMAGKLVGAVAVNRTRLVVAGVYLVVLHWLLYGQPLPLDAAPDRWFWLSLSGLIGFVLGDAALFQAFLMIGTRLTMLVFAINPIIGALLAFFFLGEGLTGLQIFGMLVTLAGVAWVVAERDTRSKAELTPKQYASGILLAVLAAAGQAGGLVTAKLGLYGNFPALSGVLIRVIASAIIIWVAALFTRQAGQTVRAVQAQPQAFKQILIASLIGPVVGVFFSLVAIQFAEIGVASTLMSLPPIFLIPIGYYFFDEKITWRAVVGTIVALVGVGILLMV